MLPTDSDNVQNTTDLLGEHLYAKVEELCPQNAEHVTGILLEAGHQEVTRMLQEDALLRRRVKGAQRVIHEESSASPPEGYFPVLDENEKDNLGEKLFFKVQELDAQHCAKVTGMLLELDPDSIRNLLSSPQELNQAVQKATATLLNEHDGYQVQIDEEKQELGEELYSKIEDTHPELASKITGMLLEMEVTHLQHLLDHPSKLNEKVQQAVEALRKAAIPTQ
ncbi:uncharacterized protein LOC117303049 [Asterias rubens]|uniref:uncharacterized protein LOC117303049 n=1 Tax=Asterias rubens TaxID=7604 RepID=UPI00145566CE|nr:uncharacterized protein LOC117303049 [Asterias rubens]